MIGNDSPTMAMEVAAAVDQTPSHLRSLMTSSRQTEANRRNALLSTGPKTEEGKQLSRQNAIRHGLTAETVIVGVEDAAEYEALEAEIIAEYEPKSAVERELTLRLASLLWRLRRASLIETGLLQVQLTPSSGSNDANLARPSDLRRFDTAIRFLRANAPDVIGENRNPDRNEEIISNRTAKGASLAYAAASPGAHRMQVITRCFLQLTDLPGESFERIGRYEAALWKQFAQVLIALDESKRHRLIASRNRFRPYPPQW